MSLCGIASQASDNDNMSVMGFSSSSGGGSSSGGCGECGAPANSVSKDEEEEVTPICNIVTEFVSSWVLIVVPFVCRSAMSASLQEAGTSRGVLIMTPTTSRLCR